MFSRLTKAVNAVSAVSAFSGNGASASPEPSRVGSRVDASRGAPPIASPGTVDSLVEAVADSLPSQYYDASYDAARTVLTDLPDAPGELDIFLRRTQAQQQKLLDAVSTRLGKEVVRNYQAFIDGMRQISEIDMDISRAGVHVSNSLRKLGNAKEVVVVGTLGIAYRRRKRERLAMVKQQLAWLRSLHQLEDTIAKACAQRKYAEAVGFIVDAQAKVRNSASVSTFAVLGALRPKVEGGLESLRGRVDRALDGLLMQFEGAGYGAVLLGYRELDEFGVRSSAAAAAAGALTGGAGTGAGGGLGGLGGLGLSSAISPAAGGFAAGGRGRAATAIDDEEGGGEELGLGLPGGEGASSAAEGGDGGSFPLHAPGTSLLAEVGGSIAAAAAAANSGVLALPNIGAADSNLAGLAAAIQAAAVKAVKALSKDAVIDQLLREERCAVEAEERKRALRRRTAGVTGDLGGADESDEEEDAAGAGALGGDDAAAAGGDADAAVGLALDDEGEAGAAGGSAGAAQRKRKGRVTAAETYAARRRDLRQRPFADLCSSIPAEEVPQACLRVAAAILHVMHSHYLLLQWHRRPFDARNNSGAGGEQEQDGSDCEFLHRSAADDDEEDAAAGSGDGGTYTSGARAAASRPPGAPTLPGVRPSPLSDPPAFLELLRAMRRFLLKGRHALWQHMQQRFATLLFSAAGVAGVNLPVERLAQCLIVSRDLMAVGLEYVGHGRAGSGGAAAGGASAAGAGGAAAAAANINGRGPSAGGAAGGAGAAVAPPPDALELDPCNTLRGSLRLLCSQYMESVHADTFERLRGLLAKEVWQRVPCSDQAMASVMESAQGGLRGRFSKAAYTAVAAATAAIRGDDSLLSGGGPGDDGGGGASGRGGGGLCRTYSDGASTFATWNDRGNPFGWLALTDRGRGGLTVLPTPRVVVGDDDSDLDDEEEEEDEGAAGDEGEDGAGAAAAGAAGGQPSARASKSAARASAAAVRRHAAAQRRAAARLMRHVHGDAYLLELGLGRGPTLGFSSLLVGGEGEGGLGLDSDDEGGSDDEEGVIEHTGGTSEEEEDDEADDSDDSDASAGEGVAAGSGAPFATPARTRRRLKGGRHRGGDGAGIAATANLQEIIAAAFGGQHGHVVTSAALNGFARAVGRYLLLMEMLPTVAGDAFTGLCRLFELYLYSVATLFVRGPALRQLFDVAPPAPATAERERDPDRFDYLDGATLSIAARVAALAADARALDHKQAGFGASSRSLASRRLAGGGGLSRSYSGGGGGVGSPSSGNGGAFDDGDFGSSPGLLASTARRGGRVPAAGERSEFESVDLYGVTVFLRGLPAMAQAQGLQPDFYTAAGPGSAAGAVLGGNSFNNEGVFVLLRRALQLIGSELSGVSGRSAARASSSVLAEASLTHDTGVSARGWAPEPFVRPSAPLELDGEGVAYGVGERAVAMESLDFMLDVLSTVRARVEAQLPAAVTPRVQAFFSRAVLCVAQLRALMYHALVPRLLPESGALPSLMAAVKWESVKEAMEPNAYVTSLQGPLTRAASLLNMRVKAGSLPAAARVSIWSCVVSHLMDRFADGVARVRKCTVPGRGLMTLDVGHAYSFAMKQCPVPPLALARDKAYVDAYVSAYYFDSETDLLQWIAKNKAAYPLRLTRAMVVHGIAASLKKKQLKDVVAAVEAMYLVPTEGGPASSATSALTGLGFGGLASLLPPTGSA